jgi:hypothetical protein
MRFPIRMFGNLTPLKQWNLHRQFKRRCYYPEGGLIFMNLKIDKINEILVVHKLLNTNKLKTKQTYIERLSFQWASYLQVNGSPP